ncbi:brachyurin [Diabrotica virgifera virgifera]|uniref:Peptidase S1 domain-containing protein n=1 Tax=Diabrotica virgifera virgifera TaxID=50390 RepID=A0ABM5IN87_DIAVI|nr:brachyurin [Diabrotica virgifera virgifera]
MNVYVVCLCFISCSLGRKLTITGGDVAVPHAYPYQVGIRINDDQFCGGSLISANFVLTAAHCVNRKDLSLDIILGAHNISDTETTQIHRTSANITIHEEFDDISFQNDIALIELDEPAPITSAIQTIPLLPQTQADDPFTNEYVTVTGWGLIKDVFNPTIKDISKVLMVVNVTVMLLDDCKKYYDGDYFSSIVYITNNNICTNGNDQKGTCSGDSGGPLVWDNVQIGIVSAGTGLCQIGAPSVFTHVGKYLDWIKKYVDV